MNLSTAKLIAALAVILIMAGGVFWIKSIIAENKVLSFENENLKTTLTARNLYIDRLNESAKSINDFKTKQYDRIEKQNDSPISPVLGHAFFEQLSKPRNG